MTDQREFKKGALVAEINRLLDMNLAALNENLSKAGRHRPYSGKVNQSGLASLMHADRGRLGELLNGATEWSDHDVKGLADALSLDEQERDNLIALAAKARRGAPRNKGTTVLFPLNRWGANMPLTRELHSVTAVEPVPDIDPDLAKLVDPDEKGHVTALISTSGIDWNESPDQSRYDLVVAKLEYRHALATRQLVTENRDRLDALTAAATNASITDILEIAPLSLISGNVNLVTADDRAVVAQRSGLVTSFKHEWNLGINEGMKVTETNNEDFFGFAERALYEELAVADSTIENIVVNWFGYCVACCNFYVYAHARTSMSSIDVEHQRADAGHGRELQTVEYVPVTDTHLTSIESGESVIDTSTTKWLHHAPLSARSLKAALAQLQR